MSPTAAPVHTRRNAFTSTTRRTIATPRNPLSALPGATSRPFQTFVQPAIAISARRFAHRCSRGVHATVIAAARTAAASFTLPVVTRPCSRARRCPRSPRTAPPNPSSITPARKTIAAPRSSPAWESRRPSASTCRTTTSAIPATASATAHPSVAGIARPRWFSLRHRGPARRDDEPSERREPQPPGEPRDPFRQLDHGLLCITACGVVVASGWRARPRPGGCRPPGGRGGRTRAPLAPSDDATGLRWGSRPPAGWRGPRRSSSPPRARSRARAGARRRAPRP